MKAIDTRFRRASLLATAATIALLAATSAQARVGVTSQTTNNPVGTPPAQQQRTLKVGIDVFANERIQTAANDRAHLLFLDGSSLTVGPNSDLMLDKFVYDPNTGTGELAVSATKGIFRLVGGKITKSNEATIKVGTSTIGIRGGITIVNAPDCPPAATSAECQAQAYFMFGDQLKVTNPDGTQTATRPGTLIAFGPGGPPAPPVVAPPNSLVGPIGQLEAPAGTGNTGPAGTGIEQKTASSNLPPSNSNLPPPVDPTNGAPQPAQMASNTTGATSNQGTQPDPNNPQQPPPEKPTAVTTMISAEGRFLREEPYSEATFSAFTITATRDPNNNTLLQSAAVTTASGLVTDPGTIEASSANGVTFSGLAWNPGIGPYAVTGTSSVGAVDGNAFVSPGGDFYAYHLKETANARGIGFFGGERTPTAGLPTTGFASRQFFTLDGTQPFMSEDISAEAVVASAATGLTHIAWSPVLSPATESPQRATWFQATLNIQGQGEAQSSFLSISTGVFFTDSNRGDTLYAGGGTQAFVRSNAEQGPIKYTSASSTAETQTGSAIYGPAGEYMGLVPEHMGQGEGGTVRTPSVAGSLPFDTLEVTDVYYPVVFSRPATAPAGLGATRTTETLTGFTGALVENNNGGGMSSYAVYNANPDNVTITKDASSNRVAGLFTLTTGAPPADEIVLQWGSLGGTSQQQQSAFIDDQRFAMREANPSAGTFNGNFIVTQMSMVTASAVALPTGILPSGVSFCECQYLTWGYWQADLNYLEGPRAGQRDYVTLGTWVAGTATANVDMPIDGTATFSGHIIGNVENNSGNSYVAVGNYSNSWDFGSRSGNLTITNFDGANYTGTTTGVVGTGRFNGSFTGTGAASDRSGQLWGAHFDKPGADGKAAYQAGSFRLNSGEGNYKASGTFASERGAITPPPIITTLSGPAPKTK